MSKNTNRRQDARRKAYFEVHQSGALRMPVSKDTMLASAEAVSQGRSAFFGVVKWSKLDIDQPFEMPTKPYSLFTSSRFQQEDGTEIVLCSTLLAYALQFGNDGTIGCFIRARADSFLFPSFLPRTDKLHWPTATAAQQAASTEQEAAKGEVVRPETYFTVNKLPTLYHIWLLRFAQCLRVNYLSCFGLYVVATGKLAVNSRSNNSNTAAHCAIAL